MSRIPRLVTISVSLYRLLLAAYPAAFRQEYGEAMAQLFRDTALDAYRRRGLLGLSAVWLRTLADFTISVIRQHRDKPVEANSESVLLRDFLQKWRRLGSEALSVTAFSTWYGLHLLRLHFWAILTVIAFGTWFVSLFDSLTWMRGRDWWVGLVRGGSLQIVHRTKEGQPISDEQWQRETRAWVKRHPTLPDIRSIARPWEFNFYSELPVGIVIQYGTDRMPALIQPYKCWRLRLPFGILTALLLGWTIRVYLRRNTGSVAAMQSA